KSHRWIRPCRRWRSGNPGPAPARRREEQTQAESRCLPSPLPQAGRGLERNSQALCKPAPQLVLLYSFPSRICAATRQLIPGEGPETGPFATPGRRAKLPPRVTCWVLSEVMSPGELKQVPLEGIEDVQIVVTEPDLVALVHSPKQVGLKLRTELC